MRSAYEFGSLSTPKENQQLGALLSQCFNAPLNYWSLYFSHIGFENFRVIRHAGQIIGGLGIYQMGQWFGGESVPTAGLAAVGIAPEHRGKGVAVELLSHTLKELSYQGIPLSTLYASTQRVYRKVGYEQAGVRCRLELPTEGIGMSERTQPMHPVASVCQEVFESLYRQQARQTNGNLERNQAIWGQVVQPPNAEVVYAYLVGEQSQPQGYIIFTQGQESQMVIRDWAALTPGAAQRLWTFLADQSSMLKKVLWHGSTLDPLLLLLPEQNYQVTRLEHWLMRVVDVPKALSMRGYPIGIEAELHLAVQDELLYENNDRFVLIVSEGKGEVTRGGRGDLQLDVRGLAPLYTGLFTPQQLQFTGDIEATDDALATAAQLFVGAQPWMPDFF